MKKRYLMLGIIIVCLAVNSSVKTLYAADAIYDLINNLVYDAIFLAELEEYDGENSECSYTTQAVLECVGRCRQCRHCLAGRKRRCSAREGYG